MSKKYYGWWYWWYYDNYSYWYGNSYWSDIYSKYSSTFSTAAERRDFKKKVNEEARKKMFPINVKTGQNWTSFFKTRKMTINVSSSDFEKLKGKESQLVSMYEKLPYNSDVIDSEAIKFYLWITSNVWNYLNWTHKDSAGQIKKYFEWMINYSEFRSMFKDISHEKDSENQDWQSEWGYKWWWEVGYYNQITNLNLYKKNLRVIQSKIRPRDITSHEESLRKGKRINPNFIKWTSYKPLRDRTVEKSRKKKIFFILDCSWSMWNWTSVSTPLHKWISFIAAAVNSWVFECNHVIYHSDEGWENVAKRIKKWEIFALQWWAEWFEVIDENLERDWLQGVDYIVTVTDLNIWTEAERWLYEYLSKWKKHLILSFAKAWTLRWMNVRRIKDSSQMIQSLVTMTSS